MYAVFDTLGPVHITPEGFENAALFLQLDLSSTLIRHNLKRSFSKTLFKPEEFGNAGIAF